MTTQMTENKKVLKTAVVLERRVIQAGGQNMPAGLAAPTKFTEGDIVTLKIKWDSDNMPRPGQFFMVEAAGFQLKRPISVSKIGPDFFEMTIRVFGSGTQWIASLDAGSYVDIIGPLGRGYDIPNFAEKKQGEKYLVIGGGIGVAPQIPLVDELTRASADFDFVAGFRGRPYMADQAGYIASESPEFAASGVFCGNVSPIVLDLLSKNKYSEIYICGPNVMIEALAKPMLADGLDPQVLLEERFACGVGACLVCSRKVKSEAGYARVCTDGPMFRASELEFQPKMPASARKPAATKNPAAAKNPDQSGGEAPDLSVDLNGLLLKNPVTTASGTFGFGREYNEFYPIGRLGGISVKGLTLDIKEGNPGRRVVETSSGMINSVGLQNPGADAFINHELPWLKKQGMAVIANINGGSVSEMTEIAAKIDAAGVGSTELNISCPNVKSGGMAFGTDPVAVKEVVSAVRRVVKGHLMVKLSPNVTDIAAIAKICEAEGADALSLINTVSGLAVDIRAKQLHLLRGSGGLSGPAIKPIALRCVHDVVKAVDIPVLGMGGISSTEDAIEFLMVGASAVAVGTALFSNPKLPLEIVEGIEEYMKKEKIRNILEFRLSH